MAGSSSPLLPKPNPSKLESPTAAQGVDDLIDRCIGKSGWAQLLQVFLVSFTWAFDAQQTFINVLTDAPPGWHCTSTDDKACTSAARPCGVPSGSWAWDQPKRTAMVSEWGLECSSPSIAGLPASAFFAGCLVGGFMLATLADSSLGRKNMLFLSCLIMSLTGALTAASPNVWAYSALRFICGFARAAVGTSGLVLSTEIVGKRWRGKVTVIGYFCFTFGFLSLPCIAYITRGSSWRNLYLWISIPSFCYTILVYFLVHESPRWLLVRGRREEAIQRFKGIALSNGTTLEFSFSDLAMAQETWKMDLFSTLKILWEKRWAFRRLATVMVVGFGVGMAYYGMPLALGNLGFNLYLSVALNALAELPAALITFFLVGKLNRKSSVLMFSITSGVCSILCVFLRDGGLRMGVEVVSFFSGCTAFDVLLIYSLELFPTCVRNSALSMVRQAVVFGGVFAPMLVVAGRGNGFLSFGVFGLVIGFCGLFVICLPETRGGSICDTMEEEEYKETISMNQGLV